MRCELKAVSEGCELGQEVCVTIIPESVEDVETLRRYKRENDKT
jgi:hypothetical protein